MSPLVFSHLCRAAADLPGLQGSTILITVCSPNTYIFELTLWQFIQTRHLKAATSLFILHQTPSSSHSPYGQGGQVLCGISERECWLRGLNSQINYCIKELLSLTQKWKCQKASDHVCLSKHTSITHNSTGRNTQKPGLFYSEPMICYASFVNYNKIYCTAVYA